ncbi:MAG TPA: hypothetical protein VM737_04935 [Gemmatimonadota bacterium]|nr:hypothetical protein [Gemmatimonadota bacterium]
MPTVSSRWVRRCLQQVVDQATAAERTLVQRRFDYYRAVVELERVVGSPLALP